MSQLLFCHSCNVGAERQMGKKLRVPASSAVQSDAAAAQRQQHTSTSTKSSTKAASRSLLSVPVLCGVAAALLAFTVVLLLGNVDPLNLQQAMFARQHTSQESLSQATSPSSQDPSSNGPAGMACAQSIIA